MPPARWLIVFVLREPFGASEIVILNVKLAGGVCALDDLDSGFLVVAYSLLEEVCLSLQGNHIHEREGVLVTIVLRDAQLEQQAVSNEPDVLVHEARVHADQLDGERLSDEVALDLHGLVDDLDNALVAELVVQVLVQQAGEVCVHALVTGD